MTLEAGGNLVLGGAQSVVFEAGVVLDGGRFVIDGVPSVTFTDEVAAGLGGPITIGGDVIVGEVQGGTIAVEATGAAIEIAAAVAGDAIDLGGVALTLGGSGSAQVVDPIALGGTDSASIVGEGVDLTFSADVTAGSVCWMSASTI